MAWRFRKSISLGKGVRLNVGKKGVGVSAGVKGFRVGINSKGVYRSMSIPGTGLYNQEYIGQNKKSGRSIASKTSTKSSSVANISSTEPVHPTPEQLTVSNTILTCMCIASFVLLFIWVQAALIGFIGAIIYYNISPNTKAKKNYIAGQKALSLGNCTTALNNFNKVLAYDPEINLDQQLAAVHSASGDKQEAITHYEKCLQAAPDDSELKERLIDEYFQNGDYEKTVEAIQTLPPEERQQLPIINILGASFLKMGKPDLALEVLLAGPTRKRKMTDDLMRFRYLLGLTYQALGDPKKAINQLNKVYVENSQYKNVSGLIDQLSTEVGVDK